MKDFTLNNEAPEEGFVYLLDDGHYLRIHPASGHSNKDLYTMTYTPHLAKASVFSQKVDVRNIPRKASGTFQPLGRWMKVTSTRIVRFSAEEETAKEELPEANALR